MAYASLSDLIAQIGDREVIAICDRNRDGVADQAVADGALQRASDTIDSYLASRYSTPLVSVPVQLKDVCCDIARYKLCGTEVTETEAVRARYKDALKTLELIRDGKIDVGLTVAGQPTGDLGSVGFVGGNRVFSATALTDY